MAATDLAVDNQTVFAVSGLRNIDAIAPDGTASSVVGLGGDTDIFSVAVQVPEPAGAALITVVTPLLLARRPRAPVSSRG